MPVTTRNQSRMIINTIIDSQKKPQSTNPVTKEQAVVKVRPDLNNLLPWFVSVAKEALKDIEKCNENKLKIKDLINSDANKCSISKEALENEYRTLYFDNVRRATELMFFVDQYLPEVRNLSPSMQRFSKVVYTKVQDLYDQIRTSDIKAKTDEEYKVVVSLITTLQDVEKNIITILPSDQQVKRRRNFVDYTGMDMIEPESEYDGVTNIWFDLTLAEDPDYEPTEDEEDDDLDRYVVYEEEKEFEGEEPDEDEQDYSEDEDYVPEDDENEDDIEFYEENEKKKTYKEPRKVWKSSNHILFEYDE